MIIKKENKIMIKKMLLVGFLAISACSYCQHKWSDPLHHPDFEASTISELDEPFISAIERHLFESKAKKTKNESDDMIILRVFPTLSDIHVPKNIYDSIYENNDFVTLVNHDTAAHLIYCMDIVLVSKKTFTNGWWNLLQKNNYYYRYKGYDIIISSSLDLIFKTSGEKKHIKLVLSDNNRLLKKKKYETITRYYFYGLNLRQYKIKDIIGPTWTSKIDEFK